MNRVLAWGEADVGRHATKPLAISWLEASKHRNPTDLVRGHHSMHRCCDAEANSLDAPTSTVVISARSHLSQVAMAERYCADSVSSETRLFEPFPHARAPRRRLGR